jgi:hypothetical protein
MGIFSLDSNPLVSVVNVTRREESNIDGNILLGFQSTGLYSKCYKELRD